MADKKHKKIKIVTGDFSSAIDEYELGLKKNKLTELQTQQKIDAFTRVQSGEATRADSVMAGYPVSALTKPSSKQALSAASIESLLGYMRNAPRPESQADSLLYQAVQNELLHRAGTQVTKPKPKPKPKPKTKVSEPVKLPRFWKSTLRRAQNTDDVGGYLKEKGFSAAQIKEAIRRDQAGE